MSIEEAISNLLDDPEFIQIDQTRQRFNIFDSIGGQRAELRHSNFLKFILSPDQNHALGPQPLRAFLRFLLKKLPYEDRPLSSLQVAVAELEQATVYREVDYIDILVVIRELNIVILIENKVGAKAGKGQLAKYKSTID